MSVTKQEFKGVVDRVEKMESETIAVLRLKEEELKILAKAVHFADEIFKMRRCARFGASELAIAEKYLE